MATQRLEFNMNSALVASATMKLFAFSAIDVVVATAAPTEYTNNKNRCYIELTDVPAGAYHLNGFVGAEGGYVNEEYDLLLATDTYLPRSELANIATDVMAALGSGRVEVLSRVTLVGCLPELVRGDDYGPEAAGGSLVWTFTLPGFNVAGASCFLAIQGQGQHADQRAQVTGTVAAGAGDTVTATFTLPRTATADLPLGVYGWSVELRDATNTESTLIRGTTELVEKYTTHE